MPFNKFKIIILAILITSCKKEFISTESSKIEFDDFSVEEIDYKSKK